MILVWDNGADSYDGHDILFYELGDLTVDEAVALLRLSEPAGVAIATVPRINWISGRTGGADPMEVVAMHLYVPYIDPDETTAEQARNKADEFIADVPIDLLAKLVTAMRKAKRNADDVAFIANALARRKRAARKRVSVERRSVGGGEGE